jgi:hypothetical protein
MPEEQLRLPGLPIPAKPITKEEIMEVIKLNLKFIGDPARTYAIMLAAATAVGQVAGLTTQQIAEDAAMVVTMGDFNGPQKS